MINQINVADGSLMILQLPSSASTSHVEQIRNNLEEWKKAKAGHLPVTVMVLAGDIQISIIHSENKPSHDSWGRPIPYCGKSSAPTEGDPR